MCIHTPPHTPTWSTSHTEGSLAPLQIIDEDLILRAGKMSLCLKGGCGQAWQPEFDLQGPHDGRRELTPTSCPQVAANEWPHPCPDTKSKWMYNIKIKGGWVPSGIWVKEHTTVVRKMSTEPRCLLPRLTNPSLSLRTHLAGTDSKLWLLSSDLHSQRTGYGSHKVRDSRGACRVSDGERRHNLTVCVPGVTFRRNVPEHRQGQCSMVEG